MNKYQFKYKYLNPELLNENWELLKNELTILKDFKLSSLETLEQFIEKVNEFDVLIEDMDSWFYIKSLQNSKDEKVQKEKNNFEINLMSF